MEVGRLSKVDGQNNGYGYAVDDLQDEEADQKDTSRQIDGWIVQFGKEDA